MCSATANSMLEEDYFLNINRDAIAQLLPLTSLRKDKRPFQNRTILMFSRGIKRLLHKMYFSIFPPLHIYYKLQTCPSVTLNSKLILDVATCSIYFSFIAYIFYSKYRIFSFFLLYRKEQIYF